MGKVRIVATCPRCGNSTWTEMEDNDFMFECLACGEIVSQEDMCIETENEFDRWLYNHCLTYFVDSENRHCICNEEWIARFKTEDEMFEYINESWKDDI